MNRTTHVQGKIALWALLALFGSPSTQVDAQDFDAVLVKDINTTPFRAGLFPTDLTVVGSKLFFTQFASGGGLWVTDGTIEGSMRLPVSDYPFGGFPGGLRGAAGTLYFSAVDGETGEELWKSDGTPAGTVKVKDINPSVNPLGSSGPAGFFEVGGAVLFTADDGLHGRELWRTDGTEAGTSMVADIQPGTNLFGPSELAVAGSLLFFALRTSSSPLREEFWRSDGTDAGTFLVKDINPTGNASPRPVTSFGGELFFTADDGSGRALWRSDGNEAGTVEVPLVGPVQVFLTRLGSSLFFQADGDDVAGFRELWKVDLVSGETEQVSDINWMVWPPTNATAVGSILYFVGDDGTTGTELWKHDPATGITEPVTDFNPTGGIQNFGFTQLTDVDGTLFMSAGPFTDRQIWTSDGTAAGTVEVVIRPAGNAQPIELTSFNGSVFFTAVGDVDVSPGFVNELWKTDGTEEGTMEFPLGGEGTLGSGPLVAPTPAAAGGGGIVVGSTLYFAANDGGFTDDEDDPDPANVELWKTDGTECGTVRVADIHPDLSSLPFSLTEVNGLVYFTADDGTNGRELWRHDPASDVTERLTDINPGSGNSFTLPMNIVHFGGLLFFPALDPGGFGLWRYDTTTSATERIADSGFGEFILIGSVVIFSGPGGTWRHDAATGVTEQFTDLQIGHHVVIGDTIFFKTGSEPALWKTDGTAAGTVVIDPDLLSPLTLNIMVASGSVYYVKGQAEPQLWRYDPVADMTEQVVDLSSIDISFPRLLIDFDGRLFFDGHGPGGSSLYAFDPVARGVEFIADPQPFDNTVSGLLSNPTIVGDTLYFFADPHRSARVSGVHELWRTDGTPAGTEKVPLSNAGISVGSPTDFNGTLLFAAGGPGIGEELYRLGGSAACEEGDDEAPSVSGVMATPNPVFVGDETVLSATGDDSTSGGSAISSASYSVDGGAPYLMDAADGAFDSAVEDLTATLSFDEPGQYELCVDVTDEALNTSAPQCVLLDVLPAPDMGAPLVSGLFADPDPVLVDDTATLIATVDDSATGGSAIVRVSYTVDGGDPIPMAPRDGAFDSSTEEVTADLVFAEAALHEICVTATDDAGNTSPPECVLLTVVVSCEGFVTGGGFLDTPSGACALSPECAEATGKATFGFVGKHKGPDGSAWGVIVLRFSMGGLRFFSVDFESLVISGAQASFAGTGCVNHQGRFGFLVEVTDARLTPETDVDRLGITIWDEENGGAVVYQNEGPLPGGQIVIHCRSGDDGHDKPGHGDEDHQDDGIGDDDHHYDGDKDGHDDS